MLDRVTATRFDRPMAVGRTGPCLMGCTKEDGTEEEVVVKLIGGCDTKERALVTEAITAMLAADLDLPVPEPSSAPVRIAPTNRSSTEAQLKWKRDEPLDREDPRVGLLRMRTRQMRRR